MTALQTSRAACIAVLALVVGTWHAWAADDPLPSWSDGPARQEIVDFVEAVKLAHCASRPT
jgi:hypothetical protein